MTDAERSKQKRRQRMKQAENEDARQVEKLYSTKPIRVLLGNAEYMIPANYFGAKWRDEPPILDAKGSFGFTLFLPHYGGFTKENWQQGWFDKRRVDVLKINPVDKNAIIPILGGGSKRIKPAGYGDPKAGFANLLPSLVRKPSLDAHELQAYVWKGEPPGAYWTGIRSNGEFFFFRSTHTPGQSLLPDTYPLCDVRYYSEKEDLFIAYRFFLEHLSKWREIDDAIWTKLHGWQVKAGWDDANSRLPHALNRVVNQ